MHQFKAREQEIEFQDYQKDSIKFKLSPLELTTRVPGSDKKIIFDYETKYFDETKGDYFKEWNGLEGIARSIGTDLNRGLSDLNQEDLQERQIFYGSNERKMTPPVTYCQLIIEGLQDFTLVILIISAIISIGFGMWSDGPEDGWYEGAAILFAVIIVLNVTAINDLQKDKQFRQLEKRNAECIIKVIRDGKPREIMIDFLQCGDIVQLSAGDMAPADALFISGTDVEMDESTMTGEPEMVKKSDKMPFIISGTIVSNGFMKVLIVGVGPHSVQGKMQEALATESNPTPLQLKLENLATQISKLGFGIAFICFFAMFIFHMAQYAEGYGTVNSETGEKEWTSVNYKEILDYFIVAITILVAAIPEGLPLAVAISLAYSMSRMQKDNILVRHLEACETMGGATTICTDKTGTLTQNKMTVVQTWVETGLHSEKKINFLNALEKYDENEYSNFLQNVLSLPKVKQDLLIKNFILNSNADLVLGTNGELKVAGSKTEGALLLFADKLGVDVNEIKQSNQIVKVYPFVSDRKRSSVLTWVDKKRDLFPVNDNSKLVDKKILRLYVKGASEMVLRLCTHILDVNGEKIPLSGDFNINSSGEVIGSGHKFFIASKVINSMANEALRTIALAYRDFEVGHEMVEENKDNFNEWINRTVTFSPGEMKGTGMCPEVEQDLVLVGIVGIQDPLRPEVPEAVRQCQEAGIFVRMVTGDNINTAVAIAKQCKIYDTAAGGTAIEGPSFRELIATTPSAFDQLHPCLQVMARSAPSDKHLLVDCLLKRGEVVAVTGDGTNDGPALKLANVGFAMGLCGTEVAKQASDIILLDDNFASIIKAVSWGRNVYDSIRKFLQFQLTVNIVALVISTIGSVSLKETPLKATQILWINLIMDSFASLALATDSPIPELLQRKPYGRNESLISSVMVRNILGQFYYQLIFLVVFIFGGEIIFEIPVGRALGSQNSSTIQYTLVFNVFVMMQAFNEISCRKVNNEWNIFAGIFDNNLFIAIVIGTLIIQIILVEFAADFMCVTKLTIEQHGACILAGIGGVYVSFLIRLLPSSMFPALSPRFTDENSASEKNDSLIQSESLLPEQNLKSEKSHFNESKQTNGTIHSMHMGTKTNSNKLSYDDEKDNYV